jgi:hypothetical protein
MKRSLKRLLRSTNSSGALAEHRGLLRSASFRTHGVIAEHAIYSPPVAELERSSPPLARVSRNTRFAPLLRLPPYGSGSQQRTLVTFMDGHRTAHENRQNGHVSKPWRDASAGSRKPRPSQLNHDDQDGEEDHKRAG